MPNAATVIAAPGTVLAGKLRVERLIGQGAMGIVYEATDITLRRRVAVKLVHPDFLNDAEKRLRFGREAYAVSRLQSKHVTQVLEISELDDGTPYFVMELLEGRTLDQVIEQDGPAAIDVALDWMLQALDAVSEAHMAGLVHRDLKPANLYLVQRKDRSAIVKVLDFGLVKDMAADAVKLTVTGSTMGSPAYMAPEQVNVDTVIDARTDVWAIGITLFELLTRELPFDGQSIPMMLRQILRENPTPLRAKRPDAPPELEMIITKCLAKDPNMRFSDAADLSRGLAAVRARLPQVSEATKTVRLPEGTVVPAGVNPMDMMDFSSVRPRLVRGDPQANTANTSSRASIPTPRREASSTRVMVISAMASALIVAGLGYVAVFVLGIGRSRLQPIPSASAVPRASTAPPPVSATVAPPPPSAVPTASASSAAPVVMTFPKVTFELPGTMTADHQKKWEAHANDLAACSKAAVGTCAQKMTVSRGADGKPVIHSTVPDCKAPATTACVEKAVLKADLPAAAKVGITFRP
jgi:serine/threonine protein kinase